MTSAGDRRVYAGVIFDVYHRERLLPDGSFQTLETVRCPDAVRVYPVTDDGQVLLIDELRAELDRRVLRVVAGRVEVGETPLEAAGRELAEELGLGADALELFATSRPMLKVEHTVHHVFAVGLHEQPARPEPGEDVRSRAVALDALERTVWDGEVAEDVIALNLLRLQRRIRFGARG